MLRQLSINNHNNIRNKKKDIPASYTSLVIQSH